jgi:hypothetical protein
MTTSIICDDLEDALINHIIRDIEYVSPGTDIYIGLFTDASPQTDSDPGTEVSGGSYERKNYTAWDAPSTSGSTANTNDIEFVEATGAWGDIRYIGVFDASTSGSFLLRGQLNADKTITTGDTFKISAGDFEWTLSGALSNALSGSIINHVLRNTSMPVSSDNIYVALYTDNPGRADSGTELSGDGYARKNITDWTTPSVGSGSTVNTGEETFPQATASWGEVTHVGVRNAETGGDLLFVGAWDTSKTIDEGDYAKIPAEGLGLKIQ